MNKKLLISLLIFVLLFCFHSNVYANNEYNGSVTAKYVVENGSKFYEKTLNQNNEINIELEDRTITITSNNAKDDDKNIVLIPVTDDAFNWLTSEYDNKTNLKAYYVNFYENNKKTSLNGNLNIGIKACDSCNLEKVYFYDTTKQIIDSTNNIDNNMSINIKKSGYLLFSNNVLKKIYLEMSDFGDLVLDNKIYKGNDVIYSDSDDKEIAIRPNSGYVIDKVLLNGVDITDKISGNYLKLNLKDTNKLKVTFKKETNTNPDNKFIISGTATLNGKPISNAKVKLHNSSLITYTDSEGKFAFENVVSGDHTISFESDNSVLGYSLFKIIPGDNKNTEASLDGDVTEIHVNNKTKIINLDLNLEKDLRIDFSNVYSVIKGDVNCDGLVNVTDLVQLRMYLAGLKTLTNRGLEAANLKEDNKIDITDLIKLRRYLAGLEKL